METVRVLVIVRVINEWTCEEINKASTYAQRHVKSNVCGRGAVMYGTADARAQTAPTQSYGKGR